MLHSSTYLPPLGIVPRAESGGVRERIRLSVRRRSMAKLWRCCLNVNGPFSVMSIEGTVCQRDLGM